MTPFEIQFMLELNCRPMPEPPVPIGASTIDLLMRDGMIESYAGSVNEQHYVLTDGGKLYIAALIALPIPIRKWVMP